MKNKVIYISSIVSILLISCVSSKKLTFCTNTNEVYKKSVYTTSPVIEIDTNHVDNKFYSELAQSNSEIEYNHQYLKSNVKILSDYTPSNIPLLDMSEYQQDYKQHVSKTSINNRHTAIAKENTINKKSGDYLSNNKNTKIDFIENSDHKSYSKQLSGFKPFILNHIQTKNKLSKLNKVVYKHKVQYVFAQIGLNNLLILCLFTLIFLSTVLFIYKEIK